jgi:hypothetical protein
MPLTVPLGARRRLSVAHSSESGWLVVRWRKPSPWDWLLAWGGGEEPPDAGVREPRRPPPNPPRTAAGSG